VGVMATSQTGACGAVGVMATSQTGASVSATGQSTGSAVCV
jgi:hypothetical protein